MARQTTAVLVAIALFATCAAVVAQDDSAEVMAACTSTTLTQAIATALNGLTQFSSFLNALGISDLDIVPNVDPRSNKVTVLAPTNAAFTQFYRQNGINGGDAALNALVLRPLVNRVVALHVISSDRIPAKAFRNGQSLNTVFTAERSTNPVALNVAVTGTGTTRTVTFTRPQFNGLLGPVPQTRANLAAPDNIKICKVIIHAVDAVL